MTPLDSSKRTTRLVAGAMLLAREWSLGALLVVAASLRLFRLEKPVGYLIFDEAYYVQDARVILGLPVVFDHLPGTAHSGLDPNGEHPPLAKLLIAAAMHLLGDRAFAWRLPSVALGSFAIWLTHAIVLRLGGTRREALLAAFVLTFDNLFFVHGRIATLDIYVTTFMLLGAWLYLSSRFEMAGLSFGVAALCKLNGFFGLAALAAFEVLTTRRSSSQARWVALGPVATTTLVAGAFFLAGLGALDCYWTAFRNPLEHVRSMILYAGQLTRSMSQGEESSPLHWWLNQNPINYLKVTTSSGGLTSTDVRFLGAMNEYVIFAAPFALVYAARAAWSSTSRLGAFAVGWFVANYLPFLLAWARAGRISYIYYMVPSLPAIAVAIALFSGALPRATRWCFLCVVLYSFCFSFPFRKW